MPRCANIGFIENLNDPQFKKISLLEEQNWEERTDLVPTPLTEEEKQEFLSQAVLNMPNEEANLYEELICKHHDVFSKNKSDLGIATVLSTKLS